MWLEDLDVGTLKVRIRSTSHTNSAPTFIAQPPIAPQCNSEPPNQFVHVLGPIILGTSDVYSKNENEENEESELQTHQQRPAAYKRAWLVDVIGKPLYIKCKMEICINLLSIC